MYSCTWSDDENDPTKWRTSVDPASQREYYFNVVTRKTQWKKPACLEQAEASTASVATPSTVPSAATSPVSETASQSTSLPQPARPDPPAAQEPKPSLTPSTSARAPTSTVQEADSAGSKRQEPEDVHRMLELLDYPTTETTEELIRQVEGITLEQYAEKYFNFDRKGMFGKRTTMEKILSWKLDVIRTSLRQLNQDMCAEAVQAFRNVTGFMGDRNTGKADMDHASKVKRASLRSSVRCAQTCSHRCCTALFFCFCSFANSSC